MGTLSQSLSTRTAMIGGGAALDDSCIMAGTRPGLAQRLESIIAFWSKPGSRSSMGVGHGTTVGSVLAVPPSSTRASSSKSSCSRASLEPAELPVRLSAEPSLGAPQPPRAPAWTARAPPAPAMPTSPLPASAWVPAGRLPVDFLAECFLQSPSHRLTSRTANCQFSSGWSFALADKTQAIRIALATMSRNSLLRAKRFLNVLLISSCTACVQAPPSSLKLCCVRVRQSSSSAPVNTFIGRTFTDQPRSATAKTVANSARSSSTPRQPANSMALSPTTRWEPPSGPGSLQP
mmetsp:Transcript_36164/g.115009  ORF Transcript_36164/g.115009 Transcript_36164/m.115009 type:complete len:291 (+) Transcript_36164:488-1360(+)